MAVYIMGLLVLHMRVTRGMYKNILPLLMYYFMCCVIALHPDIYFFWKGIFHPRGTLYNVNVC